MADEGVMPAAGFDDELNNPDFDTAEVRRVALGLGIPILILWALLVPCCMVGLTFGCRTTIQSDRYFIKKTPLFVFVGAVWLLVEFFQINWFTFFVGSDWRGGKLIYFLNFFNLEFYASWYVWFWVYTSYSMVILLIIIVCILFCCDAGGDFFALLSLLTMIPVFQPLMVKMVEALSCTYPIGKPPYLDVDPSMTCWKGEHIAYAFFASLIILVFYPALSIAMSLLFSGKRIKSVWLSFGIIQLKFLQVCITIPFAQYTVPVLFGLLGINLTYLLISLWLVSVFGQELKWARTIGFMLTIWACVATLAAYGIDNPDSWGGVAVLIVGWICIPIGYVVWRYYTKRKKAKQEEKKRKEAEKEPTDAELNSVASSDHRDSTTHHSSTHLDTAATPAPAPQIIHVYASPYDPNYPPPSPASPYAHGHPDHHSPRSPHSPPPPGNGAPYEMEVQPAYPMSDDVQPAYPVEGP